MQIPKITFIVDINGREKHILTTATIKNNNPIMNLIVSVWKNTPKDVARRCIQYCISPILYFVNSG